MEKIQFKIANFFRIIFYFYLIQFFLVIIIFNSYFLREAITSFLYFLITSCVFYFIYRNENKDDSNSLYMNNSQVVFYIRNIRHEFSWDKIETSISFRIFNFFYVIKFFSEDLNKPYYFILFSPTKDSFLQMVEKYTPKTHSLFNIANKFKSNKY